MPEGSSEQVVSRLTTLWKELQNNSELLNKDVISNSESASAVPSFHQTTENMSSESIEDTAGVSELNKETQSTWNFVNALMTKPKSSNDDKFNQTMVTWDDETTGVAETEVAETEVAETEVPETEVAETEVAVSPPQALEQVGDSGEFFQETVEMNDISSVMAEQSEQAMLSASAVPMRPTYRDIRLSMNSYVQNNVNRVFQSVRNISMAHEIANRLSKFPELEKIADECVSVNTEGKARLQMWPLYERYAESFVSNLERDDRSTYFDKRREIIGEIKEYKQARPVVRSTLRQRGTEVSEMFNFQQANAAEFSEVAYSEPVVPPVSNGMQLFKENDMIDSY
jgi:hypothetical protein